jgi:hypothetical protein
LGEKLLLIKGGEAHHKQAYGGKIVCEIRE